MGDQGTFFDPRPDAAARFPVAARAGSGHVRKDSGRVPPGLAAHRAAPAAWDGLDAAGRPAANGIYLYLLRADGQHATGKRTLVR